MKVAATVKNAYVSPCGLYRPWLLRAVPGRQGIIGRTALFCLNNPSTADDTLDDPTVTRGWGFTESWGCDTMVFVNTNCYRATNPRDRKPMGDYWAAYNDIVLAHFARKAEIVVCAWGDAADPEDARRALAVLRGTGKPPHYLGTLTKAGNPRHILYLKGDLRPTVWAP